MIIADCPEQEPGSVNPGHHQSRNIALVTLMQVPVQ